MRKSNIIIKKVRNLMILSMAVIVIISVYFNILNSRAKETTDIVANVTDETGEVDSQKVTLVATGNKNGNYEISLPETISNVYVSNYKTLNGDKSANDKIVLSQDEVENKEINLEVNYDKKNVTSTKTNEEMTLYKQNLEYDDKGIYVEGYMPLLAQINVIQNENDISLEILYTVVESNNMSTKEIYVPSEYEQTLKITLNKKKYGVEQSLISSTDAEYIVVEQSDSKLVINNISSNTINITNEEVPTIISSQYNGEDNKYYFAGGPIANSQIESIKFVTNPKEVLGTKWDASENGDNSVIAGYIDSNGNELYEIYVASNSDKTTKVYTPEDASYMFYECSRLTSLDLSNFDTSQVTSMEYMFSECSRLTSLDVSKFDTSQVTNMGDMFYECSSLTSLDVSKFNTSQVTDMRFMFYDCINLKSIYVSEYDEETEKGWTTKNVTDSGDMFTGATKLVGGNGTKFNSICIDATYAKIDKEGEPGYLTKSVKGTTFDKDEKIFISGEAVTIPAGMTVSSFKGEFESIDQGIVIYRLNGDVPDWTNKTKMQVTYDQFVWVPVKNAILDLSSTYSGLDYAGLISKVQEQINVGKYPMAIKTNTAGDYIGVLYEFSEVTENNTTYVKVIPNSKWRPKSKKGNLAYIEMDSIREPAGLTESKHGDTETNLKQINGILNTSYNSTTSFESALKSQYNEMVKKVEEKGGFWVGRYETSSMSNSTTENYIASNRIQVSSKRNTTNGINNVTWHRMYAQQKIYSELALENKTTSSMIWGSQYDQIMIWMKEEKSSDQASSRGKYYVTNGAGKGNYGTISGVENDVYSRVAPTGSQDAYSTKNIFDLAGNVYEWSLEANQTALRVLRGGYSGDTDAYYTRPDFRDYHGHPNNSDYFFGSRLTLY